MVLWDIDGTLLTGAGEGKRAFYATLEQMFPDKIFPQIEMAGRTDFGIWNEMIGAAEILDAPPFSEFGKAYAKTMANFLAHKPPSPLAGAIEICQRVHLHPSFHNGLVTGNFFEGTRVKLEGLGIWDLFNLDGSPIGGYGDAVGDKGPLALEALGEWTRRFPHRKVKAVVVGDTPEDVRSAKVAGISCLGVATGNFSQQELLECGAAAAVQNLSDTESVLSLLERIAA